MNLEEEKIIKSQYADIELPNKTVWEILQPRLIKWANKTAIVSINKHYINKNSIYIYIRERTT